MTGLAVLVAVLLVATAFGLWRAWTAGRPTRPRYRGHAQPALTRDDLGKDLGERATLVQFSTAFCAPCRATRQVLAHAADSVDGVRYVEIDAESNLDLVRKFGVTRTPTTLLVDRHGQVLQRSTGVPKLVHVSAILQQIATT